MTDRMADWWKRLVAAAIDSVIVLVPSLVLGTIGYAIVAAAMITKANQPGGLGDRGYDRWGLVFLAIAALLATVNLLYYSLLHARRGQTVGKMITGIKVVDAESAETIRFGRAFFRWLVPFGPFYLVVPLASFGILIGLAWLVVDLLWPLWDQKRQALHDKVVKSVVVEVE